MKSPIYLYDYNESDYTLDYTIYDNIVISALTSNYYDMGKEVSVKCDDAVFNFNLTIDSVNDDPVLTIPDFETDEGTPFSQLYDLNNYVTDIEDTSFNFTVTDENDVNCSLVGDSLNMTFSSNYTGTTTCSIRVEDTDEGTDVDTFSITVKDLTSPVVLHEINALTSKYWAIITWETDEEATSIVRYGTSSGSYTDTESSSTYTTSHSVTLTLDQNTTYYFVVKSEDSSGNYAQSSEHSLKTVADTAEPYVTIVNPTSDSIDERTLNMTVMTDKESTCKYSTSDENYSSMNDTMSSDNDITHYVELTGLEDGRHNYYIRCEDEVGNTMSSSKEIEFDVDIEVVYEVSYETNETEEEEIIYYTTSFDREQTMPSNMAYKMWNNPAPSEKYTWQINKDLFALTDISFYLRTGEDNVSITLTRMLDGPTERYVLDRQVYQYIGVEVTDGSPSNLNKIRFSFKVSKKWLNINKIDKEQVKLFRYTNKWDDIHVDIVDENQDFIYYNSLVPGFSLFAISYDPFIEVTSTSTTTTTSVVSTTTTIVRMNETNTEEILPSTEIPSSTFSIENNTKLIFTGIILLFALLAIVLIYVNIIQPKIGKKKEEDELKSKIQKLEDSIDKSLITMPHKHEIYSPKSSSQPRVISQTKVQVKTKSEKTPENIKRELNNSLNSKEFIEYQIKSQIRKNSEMIKQGLKQTETSPTKDEIIQKPVHVLTKIESKLIKKYITGSLKEGISKENILKNLAEKDYDEEEMKRLVNSISKSLEMNRRLQNISDKLANMYKRD